MLLATASKPAFAEARQITSDESILLRQTGRGAASIHLGFALDEVKPPEMVSKEFSCLLSVL